MNEISCAALLFDLDGVLINSTPAVARVWSKWALERGFNPEEVVARAHGRPSLTTIRDNSYPLSRKLHMYSVQGITDLFGPLSPQSDLLAGAMNPTVACPILAANDFISVEGFCP